MKLNSLHNLAALLAASALALHAHEPDQARLRNLDKRQEATGGRAATVAADQTVAVDHLKQRIPGTRIVWNTLLASPGFIFNDHGFLSGPDSEDEVLKPKTLAAAEPNADQPRDPHRCIKRFLDENAALFGHGSEILSVARISREYVTAHNGMRTVVWEQQLDGIPVFEAVLYAHVARNGELVSLSSQFMPVLAAAADARVPERQRVQETPTISARQAVALAAAGVETVNAADGAAKRRKHRV